MIDHFVDTDNPKVCSLTEELKHSHAGSRWLALLLTVLVFDFLSPAFHLQAVQTLGLCLCLCKLGCCSMGNPTLRTKRVQDCWGLFADRTWCQQDWEENLKLHWTYYDLKRSFGWWFRARKWTDVHLNLSDGLTSRETENRSFSMWTDLMNCQHSTCICVFISLGVLL